MKSKSLKLLSCVLSVAILSSSSFATNIVYAEEKEIIEVTVSESKITDSLAQTMLLESDKIPVYIWYNSVDRDIIENRVADKIGFSSDEIEESYPLPKNELINELSQAANGDPNEYLKLMMENHLKMTADEREEERQKTEIYIEALNNELRETYCELSSIIKKDNAISDDDVIFTSSYAPMIIASLSPDEINNLADDKDICQLDLYEEYSVEFESINMGTTMADMGIDNIASSLSLTGNNVKIGIHDSGYVSTTLDTSALNYNLDVSKVTLVGNTDSQGDHATYVAAIAAGRDGVAPNAPIYSASANSDTWGASTLNNYEALITAGARVINCSWVMSSPRSAISPLNLYTSTEKYFDNVIAQTGVTTVFSAGNNDTEIIREPSLAFNIITVNGFMNNVINNYSYDHNNGCYKPDVVACSLNNGTSVSAPVISGMIALLYEYKPNLMTHPETVKAILLASVHEKIQYAQINNVPTQINEYLSSGSTNRQGAGVPNLYRMISIVAQHSYGYGRFNSNNGYSREIPILQPRYGASNINASMAYLQTDVEVGNPSTRDDYDISLLNPSLSTKSSAKSLSSTEMVYSSMSNTNNNYTLKIERYNSPSSPMIHMSEAKYGYAWSTDNTVFYPSNYEEGVYYIKNASSGKYLSYNNNNNNVKLENFNGNTTQLWVINDDFGILDYLKSANGYDKNLDLGSLTGSFYKAVRSTNSFMLNLFNNSDGTYSFERFISTSGYRLGVYNNSNSSGVDASWYSKDVNNQFQKWHLEATGYKRGDVDLDGSITTTDAALVLNIYSAMSIGNNTANNIEMFLADFNGDRIIDATDASLILNATT